MNVNGCCVKTEIGGMSLIVIGLFSSELMSGKRPSKKSGKESGKQSKPASDGSEGVTYVEYTFFLKETRL